MTTVFREAALADGVMPVNESGLLVIDGKRPGHVIERDGAAAVVDLRDGTIMLAVSPGRRRQGLGTALLTDVLAQHPGLPVWAFGSLPGSAELAAKVGLHAQRTLLKMARPLAGTDAPAVPASITPYTADDAEAIVRINAAAFEHHPEQGLLTLAEFHDLTAQPWFSAPGLLVARDGDEVVGFHWTKRHGEGVGEVYVLAVDPAHEGRGWGRALLSAGLRHLHDEGDETVELYVEAAEERVVAMYTAAGFEIVAQDTSHGRTA